MAHYAAVEPSGKQWRVVCVATGETLSTYKSKQAAQEAKNRINASLDSTLDTISRT